MREADARTRVAFGMGSCCGCAFRDLRLLVLRQYSALLLSLSPTTLKGLLGRGPLVPP